MTVNRFDRGFGEHLTTKATYREDGSLVARSIVTSIGVFPYKMANGTIRREFRPPETVFDPMFLDSLKNAPIFVGHHTNPDGTLITDKTKLDELTVGKVGEDIIGDNVYVSTPVEIVRKDGLDAIKNGWRSFSVGYSSEYVETPGVWGGIAYDGVQTNLRANHVALVPVGRAGDSVVLRMDSADAIMVEDAPVSVAENNNSKEERMATMRTIQLDSVDYEADEVVIARLKDAEAKLDSLNGELEATNVAKSTIEAERDSMKERLDSAEAKVKELEAARLDEGEIEKRVASRIALNEVAKKAGVEVKADMADIDVKKAVVMAKYPNTKLDGKDDTYINVRFDCAIEDMEAAEVASADASVREASSSTVNMDSAESADEIARKAYLARTFGQK